MQTSLEKLVEDIVNDDDVNNEEYLVPLELDDDTEEDDDDEFRPRPVPKRQRKTVAPQ